MKGRSASTPFFPVRAGRLGRACFALEPADGHRGAGTQRVGVLADLLPPLLREWSFLPLSYGCFSRMLGLSHHPEGRLFA